MYEKVKKLCKEKGISIYSLEKELKLSNGSIIKWNKSIPRAETMLKLSKYFNVPIEYFLSSKSKTTK